MRAQIITYYHERQGSGLNDVAKAAVGVLAEQAAKSEPAAARAAAAPVDKVAPANDFSRTPDPADKFGGAAG
jgi:hypothetical protein